MKTIIIFALLIAPLFSQPATITATSKTDPTKSDTATPNVQPPITVVVSPKSPSVLACATVQFSATTTDPAGVNWIASAGTITTTGLWTAPCPLPIKITVSPATATLGPGAAVSFFCSTTNASGGVATPTGCTWTLTPNVGTFSAPGAVVATYTAPATILTPQTVTLTASAVAAPTVKASVVITLTAGSASNDFCLHTTEWKIESCTEYARVDGTHLAYDYNEALDILAAEAGCVRGEPRHPDQLGGWIEPNGSAACRPLAMMNLGSHIDVAWIQWSAPQSL